MATWGRYAVGMVALAGCATATPAAPEVSSPRPAAPLARECAVEPPGRGGGVLSAALVGALHDESASILAEAICECADGLAAPLPGVVRAIALLVPGRGELLEVRPLEDAAHVIVDTDGALDACVAERASRARLPVHVVGSDVVPDPDPTDERVVMPYWVRVSSAPPLASRPR